LTVRSGLNLPSCRVETSSAPILSAWMPSSGRMAAWDALPASPTESREAQGPSLTMAPNGSLLSNTTADVLAHPPSEACADPRSPASSETVKSSSTVRRLPGARRAATASASMIAATPDLSSAPRTVVPDERITPSMITGSIPVPGETVSRWDAKRMGFNPGAPSSTACRLPESPPVLAAASSYRILTQPDASSSAAIMPANPASWPLSLAWRT